MWRPVLGSASGDVFMHVDLFAPTEDSSVLRAIMLGGNEEVSEVI